MQREDILDWPREFPKNIPMQKNCVDCGMFTILFADYAVRFFFLRNVFFFAPAAFARFSTNLKLTILFLCYILQSQDAVMDFSQANIQDFRVRTVRDIMRSEMD